MSLLEQSDTIFMRAALDQANLAYEADEVPVGAIVTCRGLVIAKAHNQTEQLTDATAHAEMIALTAAEVYLGSKYLEDCTLYVTLEPCVMCAGAAYWTRIGRIVVGAADPKRGFRQSGVELHPRTTYLEGVEANECANLLHSYFREKRESL